MLKADFIASLSRSTRLELQRTSDALIYRRYRYIE